jgi:serine/threonine protein kinase
MTLQVQEGTILLGKYRVEKTLGHGAMGYVVAARHEHLGELHALKLMQPEALKTSDAAERFLREAKACARLKSDHTVRIHDLGRLDDGSPVIAMEYLEGRDLQSVLDERKQFPLHEAALYVHQACEAVAEAHALGIVHRDLKPSNLFLTFRPNGSPCVKVLDFGISKQLGESASNAAKLTATGSVIGTPLYMSPEQILDSKTTDTRGDIWSIGVILYEFATGQLPFPGESFAPVMNRVLNTPPIPLTQWGVPLPAAYQRIVMRCLEKDPAKRFSSVRELMTALEPFTTTIVVQAGSNVANPSFSNDVDVEKDTTTMERPDHKDDSTEQLAAPVFPAAGSDEPLQGASNSHAQRFLRNHTEKLEAQRIARRRKYAKRGIMAVVALGVLIVGVVFFEKWEPFLSGLRSKGATAIPSAAASASSNQSPLPLDTAPPKASTSVAPINNSGASKAKAVTNLPKSAISSVASAGAPTTAKSAGTALPSASPSAAAAPSSSSSSSPATTPSSKGAAPVQSAAP